jgi:hypothetical protein
MQIATKSDSRNGAINGAAMTNASAVTFKHDHREATRRA